VVLSEGMAFASLTKPVKVEAAGPDLSFFTLTPGSGVKEPFFIAMQHVIETGKRVFSAAVAAATIAFSVGAGLLVSPASVSAASAGDLIKGTSLSTVYYYGYDGMRYVFPNEATYMTWYSNFNGVSTISDSALSNITLGGNVVMRPGSWWVKVQSSADTYAVARNGMLHWIETADVAEDLAGSDWNQRIVDVPDVFFADYTVGTSLMKATAYEGALYEVGGTTYVSWDGEMREVTSAGMSANGFMSKFVLDGSSVDDSALTMGSKVTGELTALADVAQTETSDEPSVAGDLTFSEASSMPVGSSVTKGANGVEVFSFDVEAGSEDATLNGLVLSLTGAGSATDISAAYLYEGATRLTESRTVNSSTREVTFNSLDVEVPAGDTVTLTLKVTMSTTAQSANTFGFEIESADAVTASGDVSGRFPVSGDEFSVGGASSGTVTVAKTGTVTNPTVGETDAEIAEFKVTAGTEDASVESITLKVDNASDHSNFNLWDGSTWLVECENTSGDLVVCDLSDDAFLIEEGDNNIFKLSADIGGQNDDDIKVYVDNAIDVVAVGGDFGYGLSVTDTAYDGDSCTSSSGDCSFSTVQGGDVTFAFNGPSAGDVQVDAQDQVLVKFSLTASQEVTVKDLDVVVYGDDDADDDATDGADAGNDDDTDGLVTGNNDGVVDSSDVASITDIKIVNTDTGAVVMGPMELDNLTDDASQTIDFTDDFVVEAGKTLNLAVTVDVDDLVGSGTEFAASLDVSGLSIEDENGDALSSSDIVPGSDLTGYNQSAKSASLAIALASTPGDTTTVQGVDSHTAVGFTFTAGDASDITVTELTLSAYGDADDTELALGGETDGQVEDYVESCSLYEGSTLVAGPEAPSSTGSTITFDSMDWMLKASKVVTLNVKCNLANPSESTVTYLSFDIADASSDVTAEDEDGDAVEATGDRVNGGTEANNIVSVNASGSVTAAVASDMPDADFLRTGTVNNHVATYRFTAANEAFTLSTLSFSEEQAEDDTGTANSNAYANNISTVSLAWDGMKTASPSASMSGNVARFSGLSIPVAVDAPTDVDVYVNVPSTDRVSGGSATSNEKVRMALYTSGAGNTYFKATGSGSGAEVNGTTQADIGGAVFATDGVPTFVVKETYPSVARSSASPTSAVAGGRPEVLRFNVSATSGEDVVMDRVIFKMTSTDVSTSNWNKCDSDTTNAAYKTAASFDIYDRANLTTALDTSDAAWSLYVADGSVCGTTATAIAFVGVTFSSDEVVTAGTTKTYSLYMSAVSASADNDSVFFEVVQDPIVSTFLVADADGLAETLSATDTVVDVETYSDYLVGDILCMDTNNDDACGSTEERMLVVASTDATQDYVTVVRGYLNTLPDTTSANVANDSIHRMPSSFTWKDDGVSGSVGTQDDWWGAYLVDITDFSGASSVRF
jgi:hypothetical protein